LFEETTDKPTASLAHGRKVPAERGEGATVTSHSAPPMRHVMQKVKYSNRADLRKSAKQPASESENKMSSEAIVSIDIEGKLPKVASGKVRDLFAIDDETLLFVASDRISAYDVVMENVSLWKPHAWR
jgi:hypothetical protein